MKTSIEQEIRETKNYMRRIELEVIEAVGDETRKGFVSHALVKIKELAIKLKKLSEKTQIANMEF